MEARRGTIIHKDTVDNLINKRPNEPGVAKTGTGNSLGTYTFQYVFQALLISYYLSPSAPLCLFLVLLIAVSNVNGSLVAASPSRPVLTISDYPLCVAYILKWGPGLGWASSPHVRCPTWMNQLWLGNGFYSISSLGLSLQYGHGQAHGRFCEQLNKIVCYVTHHPLATNNGCVCLPRHTLIHYAI